MRRSKTFYSSYDHVLIPSEDHAIISSFPVFHAGHSLCSMQDIHCVPSRTFLVFTAGHSLCSKQNIPCVRNKTFRVFEAGHSVCSKQDIPCVRSRTFLVFEAGHSLCSKQDILCVRSRTLLVLRTKDFVCSNHQQCTCHFLVNSANRPRIWANPNQIRPSPGTIDRIRQKMACEIFELRTAQNREDSSDFGDFWTQTIAATRSFCSKIFTSSNNFSRCRKKNSPSSSSSTSSSSSSSSKFYSDARVPK